MTPGKRLVGIADGWFVNDMPEIDGRATQLNAKGPSNGSLGLGRIGTGMATPIPSPDMEGSLRRVAKQDSGKDHDDCAKTGWGIVC